VVSPAFGQIDLTGPLLDLAPGLVGVLAGDGTVQRANRRACELLGRTEAELLGTDWFATAVPRDWSATDANAVAAAEELPEDEERFEVAVRDAQGRERLVAWSTVLLRDAAGAPAGVLWSGEEPSSERAGHDALTGLPGRALLEDHLQLAIARGRRNGTEVALLLIDLDGFAMVNAALGREAGDDVLRQTALRLREVTRAHDVLARIGGDEVALLIADLDQGAAESATIVGRLIRDSLAQPFLVDGTDFHLGASIGVGLFPDHADNAADLLHRADVALRQAKRSAAG
jgi:diguanylate cyclase (GGDEF)-like protein/PAS domain S-box-containing protein